MTSIQRKICASFVHWLIDRNYLEPVGGASEESKATMTTELVEEYFTDMRKDER